VTPPTTLETQPETQAEAKIPTVGFVSLGCPKNLVDSEVMMGLLHHGGARITPRAEDADILVVNTCSFIDSAKQESVDAILDMARHKTANGGRAQKLIVAGCLVERYRDEIQRNIPEVDAVVGTGELESILAAAGLAAPAQPASPFNILQSDTLIDRASSAVAKNSQLPASATEPGAPYLAAVSSLADMGAAPQTSQQSAQSRSPDAQSRAEGNAREQAGRFSRAAWDGAVSTLPDYLYSDTTPRILSTQSTSAYIKIAEGCDHPCTFCIIPQLRGKFRSRPIASIVAEAKSLIAQGVREITLIGQDTTCYGEDLPPQSLPNSHKSSSSRTEAEGRSGETPVFQNANVSERRPELADLLEALAPLEGLTWLRFLYAYPNKITTRLLEAIARHDNIAKYLDVPLQHASPRILKSMKRGGTPDRFLQILEHARRIVPNLTVRSTFIVGFPGETPEDFQQLEDFISAAKIDWLGVFSYSDEEGAAAFDIGSKVPKRTIESRRRKLMKLQQKISAHLRASYVGQTIDVLVEGPSEETDLLWQGRALHMAPEIDGKILINDFGPHDQLVPGTFYRAQITESHDYDLVATILE
jgi:ribosomal protein S12 methylthiotransferase